MSRRNGPRNVILLSLLILTAAVPAAIGQAGGADAAARELLRRTTSQVRSVLRAPATGAFDVGTRRKFDELSKEQQERAAQLGYKAGDAVWIGWRDGAEEIVERDRTGNGPLAEILQFEASMKVPRAGGPPEMTLISVAQARMEDLNDEVQHLAREKDYTEGDEVRFKADPRESRVIVLASPRLASSDLSRAEAEASTANAAGAPPRAANDPCAPGATASTALRGVKKSFQVRLGEMTGFMTFKGCAHFSELPGEVRREAERYGYRPGDRVFFRVFKGQSEIIPAGEPAVDARKNEPPIRWMDKKTMVSIGMELPEPAGATLDEIGDFAPPVWLDSGDLIFWGRHDKEWGVYRWHEGRVTSALDSETAKQDRYWLSTSIRFRPYFQQTDGGDALFAFAPRNRWYCGTVYHWNGSALEKVVSSGDTLELGTTRSALECATLLGVSSEGQAIVFYTTAGSTKAKGIALLENDPPRLQPLFVEGEEVPGLPGLRVGSLSGYDTVPPVVLGKGTLAHLPVAGAGSAILRFSQGETETLIANKDPHPLVPAKRLLLMRLDAKVWSPLNVSDADTFAFVATAKTGRMTFEETLLLYDEGRFYDLFDVPYREAGWDGLSLGQGMFLKPGSTRYVYIATVARTVKGQRESLTNLLLADRDTLVNLTPDIRVGRESTLIPAANGVLLKAQRGVERVGSTNLLIKPAPEYWYLDGSSDELRLKRFELSHGLTVGLEIVAFRNPNEIVARTSEGVYLYERVP